MSLWQLTYLSVSEMVLPLVCLSPSVLMSLWPSKSPWRLTYLSVSETMLPSLCSSALEMASLLASAWRSRIRTWRQTHRPSH